MSDIMKFIVNKDAAGRDPEGNLLDLEEWSESRARELAEAEGIAMTDNHMEVAVFLRDRYRQHGDKDSSRELAAMLEQQFADRGGSRYLYSLYPGGPVGQGSRIAGLPSPQHSSDKSFGTVQ